MKEQTEMDEYLINIQSNVDVKWILLLYEQFTKSSLMYICTWSYTSAIHLAYMPALTSFKYYYIIYYVYK